MGPISGDTPFVHERLAFRRATEADLDRLVELHFFAYPEGGYSETTRRRHFTHNSLGSLRDVIVAEHADRVIAHAFLFPLRASFGGRSVRVGGVASVAVAPEMRGRGVATALMEKLHALSDRRGDAVTMLYAFRHGYYARLDYGTTSSRKRLSLDARSIPPTWTALAKTRVRAARGSDRDALRAVHARTSARASGVIRRSSAFWDSFVAKETRLVLVSESSSASKKVSGYAAFQLEQDEAHGETRLVVDELLSDDDASRRALFGALAAMRDQISEIVVEVPEADPLERALVDPDGRRYGTGVVEHGLGEVVGGPMLRVADVPRAIAARGYTGSGSFDVVVAHPDGERAVSVRVRDGRAVTGRARGTHELRTSRAVLASVFYGGLSVADAVLLDLAHAEPAVAARIDAIVRLPPLSPFDVF